MSVNLTIFLKSDRRFRRKFGVYIKRVINVEINSDVDDVGSECSATDDEDNKHL